MSSKEKLAGKQNKCGYDYCLDAHTLHMLYVPVWHNPSLCRKTQPRDKLKDYKAVTPNIYY